MHGFHQDTSTIDNKDGATVKVLYDRGVTRRKNSALQGVIWLFLSQISQIYVTNKSCDTSMLATIVLTHGSAPSPRKNFMFKRSFMIALAAVAVLGGCATSMQPVSVADTLATQPQLSTLNSLIIKAGLTDTLKGTGPFTVFAPTNEAFAKVPAKTMEALASNPEQLKSVLAYHVIPGKLMLADVKNGNSKTVNGANVALARAGDFVTVEDGLVQKPDIAATNGVVHIVDSVLMPPVKR
jgi:uncharacterized surface protein with fasciclin (FAS1) repeats